ncbi:2-carboxy-D-arabinitol-1-phosphatase [Carex littledalei]|uniref:2-carboxy-D-arabinitol-1-phosphatase n=1 Tax=Carex littledalei TaxID=544730 RepID=A0A833VFR9_9POAL|nr:2-carboxy-D-arabinitol-1-phosphatase [Carex littledalei]
MLSLVCSPTAAIPARRRPVAPCCSTMREAEASPSATEKLRGLRDAKRVVLVRHGQSTWNEEGRIQGSSDYSMLTSKGESQAETSRQMLLSDTFDVCFTSPLIRSKRTAEIIWDSRQEEMLPDSDLREIDLYSFQGLLKHEGKERYGSNFLQWQKDAPNFNIDGHYPVRELWDRARNCWNRILAHEGKSVLVVAHNAVNQALVATALGLGTEYFRILLQSNCGVSVIDFTPQVQGGTPNICLNRLNQTPYTPVASGTSGGRKAQKRIILVCQGATQNSGSEFGLGGMGYEALNMLGIIQSQKTAELLLDMNVNCIVSSPRVPAIDTATAISEVQAAADCLGADCVPRYVELKQLFDLEVEPIFQQARKKAMAYQSGWLSCFDQSVLKELCTKSVTAWQALLKELSSESEAENNLVVVGHPAILTGLLCQCLHLSMDWMPSFHLDAGSVSVIDFPDGPAGRGVVRCTNYTAHLGRWSIPITRSTVDDEAF